MGACIEATVMPWEARAEETYSDCSMGRGFTGTD